jgi:hypothetical protein
MSQLELSRQAAERYAQLTAAAERTAEAKRSRVRSRVPVWQRLRAVVLKPV